MSNPAYIPPLPEHLDFDLLRDQTLARLQALAGGRWTDYNAHDPGLTLLEALCYALTDLGYRAGHAMPDLLAGEIGSFYVPEQALPGAPVSQSDLLRSLYARSGVALARLEALQGGEQQPELYYYPHSEADGAIGMEFFAGAEPVALQGLYRAAAAWASEDADENKTKAKALWHWLQTARGLCTDIAEDVQPLRHEKIPLYLTLDLAPSVGDTDIFTLDLLKHLAQHIARLPQWQAARDRPAGVPAEVWQEQSLDGGYLSPEALAQLQPREGIYASDIAQWLMDQPGVENVRRISFEEGRIALVKLVSPDKAPVLDISITAESLKLLQRGRTLGLPPFPTDALESALARSVEGTRLPTSTITDFPGGRDRRIGHYHSIQYDLPELYGLSYGTEGLLPAQAARRRQLSAYLLFFEQALAGQFAQLDYGRRLFDLQKEMPGHTYARPDLAGIPLGNEVLADSYQESEASPGERLQRLYDHLLARVGEQVYVQKPEKKLHFLKNWPEWSAKRGLGFDYNQPGSQFYLEARITALLGLETNERFYLVENILLRAVPEDQPDDEGNWLIYVPRPDPYSLRISCVLLPELGGRFVKSDGTPDKDFRTFVCRIIREEVPAHIAIDWLWLDGARMTAFNDAWQSFREALTGIDNSLDRRISRDAVLDQLYNKEDGEIMQAPQFLIGWPAPLLDICPSQGPGSYPLPGERGLISLDKNQLGVRYILCDRNGKMLQQTATSITETTTDINEALSVLGTGQPLTLTTIPLRNEDETFTIRAVKTQAGLTERSGHLRCKVRMRVGISSAFMMSLDTPVIDYGAQAVMRLWGIQAEVLYRMVEAQTNKSEERSGLEQGALVINSFPLTTDTLIQVAALRQLPDGSEIRKTFDTIFPVFVRPQTNLEIQANQSAFDHGARALITIKNSEQGVFYQLKLRPISDDEFKHGSRISEANVEVVLGPDQLVRLKFESSYAAIWPWESLSPVAGNGGDLTIETSPLTEDAWIEVYAYKERSQNGVPLDVSAVLIHQVPLLVYPRTEEIQLEAVATVLPSGGEGLLKLSNVQTGVFYYLISTLEHQMPLSQRIYIHDTEGNSPRQDGIALLVPNTGMGSKIEVDWVIGPPQLPGSVEIRTLPFTEPGVWGAFVVAAKAQTGLWKTLFTLNFDVRPPDTSTRSAEDAPIDPPPPTRRRNNNP